MPSHPESAYAAATRHLRTCQPQMRSLIEQVGPCTLRPNPNYFVVLARTIVSQQLSTRAAETICRRLQSLLGGRNWRPEQVLKIKPESIRDCGLSAGKVKSLLDLAQKIVDRAVPIRQLAKMEDDEIRACLLEVHGIGPWSVDMFLIFSLGRPDVLPVGDLGLRAGVRDLFALPELPGPAAIEEHAEPWRPFRSIATWYIWRSRGVVPQSKPNGFHHAVARRRRS